MVFLYLQCIGAGSSSFQSFHLKIGCNSDRISFIYDFPFAAFNTFSFCTFGVLTKISI